MPRRRLLTEPGTGQAIATWVDASLIPLLDGYAARHSISRSTAAREIILDYFKSRKNDQTPAA